ncbi:MAG: Rieske 2Fe-2S domain-containing protein [Dehalococcoidia bacterium]|nr:Rieske 2Fe-2S domain-containing protein [Dehalococcoidia bacterium]
MRFPLLKPRAPRRKMTMAGGASIPEGEARRLYLGGRWIIVAKLRGQFYAMSALCTHWPEMIDPTILNGCEVRCPIHWATFDVTTGRATGGPTRKGVPTYPVTVQGPDLLIEMPD